MTTLATVDLEAIHKIYKELKKDNFQYGERFLYFLAKCQYLVPDLDLDIAMKMKPFTYAQACGTSSDVTDR